MTDRHEGVDVTAPGWKVYARLGKLSFFDYYLCIFVVVSALSADVLGRWWTWLVVAALMIGYIGLVAATAAFDDISGFMDGSDAKNYLDDPQFLRKASLKPLIMQEMTLSHARRFAWLALTVGVVGVTAGFMGAPHHPWWLIVYVVAASFLGVQYSWGLNLSHVGGQELILFFGVGSSVFVGYVLLAGEFTVLIAIESILFGLWALMVSIYSNINDLEVDRRNSRVNLATKTSSTTYARVISALMLLEFAVVVIPVVGGWISPWILVSLLPLYGLRVQQYRIGIIGSDPLRARLYGIAIHRTGVALIVIGNVVVLHLLS